MENITIEERQAKDKQALIEILKEMPIVQIACKRAGISRATYYRWRKEDKDFLEQSDNAFADGVEFINDMSEGQLISLIREKSWSAISFWLRKRSPKFKDRIEVSGEINIPKKEMTPEQQVTVSEALKLAKLASLNVDEGAEVINSNNNENNEKSNTE